MAGARARKIDLSGYLAGNANVASIISRTGEVVANNIANKGNAHLSAITQLGANLRENKRYGEEKAYRAERNKFTDKLALNADARAEADQSMQKDRFGWEKEDRGTTGTTSDSLIKSASDFDVLSQLGGQSMGVDVWAENVMRAKTSAVTGAPMDPQIFENLKKYAPTIMAGGGPAAIKAKMDAALAAMSPADIAKLSGVLESQKTLHSLLKDQWFKDKNTERRGKIGDSLITVASNIATTSYWIEKHGEKAKKDAAVEETRAKAAAEAAVKAASEKAELDAWNADLAKDGKPPVTSLEYGKMKERERGIDERTAENIALRREVEARRKEENDRKQDEVERENRAKEAVNTAVLEIRKSAEARAVGKAGFDVEAEINKNLDKRIDDARAAMTATDQAWYRLVGESPKDPERAELAARRQHYEAVLGRLMTEREKRAGERLGAPPPAAPPDGETPWQKAQKDPDFSKMTTEQREALRKRLGG